MSNRTVIVTVPDGKEGVYVYEVAHSMPPVFARQLAASLAEIIGVLYARHRDAWDVQVIAMTDEDYAVQAAKLQPIPEEKRRPLARVIGLAKRPPDGVL